MFLLHEVLRVRVPSRRDLEEVLAAARAGYFVELVLRTGLLAYLGVVNLDLDEDAGGAPLGDWPELVDGVEVERNLLFDSLVLQFSELRGRRRASSTSWAQGRSRPRRSKTSPRPSTSARWPVGRNS